MSKRASPWIIIILPTSIMDTIVYDPVHYDLFEYTTQKYKSINNNVTMNKSSKYVAEPHMLYVTRYSRSLQNYNKSALFMHLIIFFIANLAPLCILLLVLLDNGQQLRKIKPTRNILLSS